MSDIETLRKQKIAQMKAQLQNQQAQQNEQEQQLAQVEAIIKQHFTPKALERYSNIRVAHPQVALKVIMVLAQALQTGQIRQKIDDDTLKAMLRQLQENKEIKITRK